MAAAGTGCTHAKGDWSSVTSTVSLPAMIYLYSRKVPPLLSPEINAALLGVDQRSRMLAPKGCRYLDVFTSRGHLVPLATGMHLQKKTAEV
jgi:hypothetical protein